MYKLISKTDFINAFMGSCHDQNFSYSAKCALYDYLIEAEEFETDTELDIVNLACSYDEFDNARDAVEMFCPYFKLDSEHEEEKEWVALECLRDSTTVILCPALTPSCSDTIIVAKF